MLLDFNGVNGKTPYGSLLLSGKKLYGMTYEGGLLDSGNVFSIDTNGNNYKDLLDFNTSNGKNPWGSLILIGKRLYGMTYMGGANLNGCIFSVDTDGGYYNDKYDFSSALGEQPLASLISSGKNLYGTASIGGTNNDGVVFRIDTATVTSVNNLTASSNPISVFPNPSSGIFTLALTHPASIAGSQTIVEVYNVLGEKVTIATLKPMNQVQGDNLIDLSKEPNGVYFYRVISDGGLEIGSGKLIKDK